MENILQAAILKKARKRGCLAYKVQAVSYVGFPDTMVIFPGGRIILVEVKTPTGRLRPAQVRRIKQLRLHGVPVYVVNSLAQFEKVMDTYVNESTPD